MVISVDYLITHTPFDATKPIQIRKREPMINHRGHDDQMIVPLLLLVSNSTFVGCACIQDGKGMPCAGGCMVHGTKGMD